MRTKVQDNIKNLSQEDLELAQERDFDLILFDLQNRLQSIYDQAKESKNGKVIMDISFVMIQDITEQAEKLLKS
ncbi:hypothetical protein D3C74_91210 [compost metagenome]